MLDIKWIREQPETVKTALRHRNLRIDVDALLAKDAERRKLLAELDGLRHQQNMANDEIAALKKQQQDAAPIIARMKSISQSIDVLRAQVGELDAAVDAIVWTIPNVPHHSIPVGDESAKQTVREWGERRTLDFAPRTHVELAEILGVIDFPRAAKISGSNFVLFKGWGARLERALINFMLDVHTKRHGYIEIFPPFLVNRASMFGTGQLPKLEEDMYRLKDDDLFLIPTAEVPVTNMHRDEVLKEEELPVYYAAYSACFRREAGSYGKETKGMVRVHQFDKVELVKFVKPETSYDELDRLVANAEEILRLLELPYRVVVLPTGDLSFSAAKCYDIEAWVPGAGGCLEVSSCSNFEDFQARRANIKYRPTDGSKPRLVHTLNGSGVALARTVICLLENHQQRDGSVRIPAPLQPYLDGLQVLEPKG